MKAWRETPAPIAGKSEYRHIRMQRCKGARALPGPPPWAPGGPELFSGEAAGLHYPSAMPQTPIIDPQAIDNLRMLNPDDGDEFLREIVAIFVADTPKRILELAEIEELSYREIARALDCPVGTVMSRLHRARRRLRQAAVPARHPAQTETLNAAA